MNEKINLYDEVTFCKELVERVSILFNDILYDLIYPLDKGDAAAKITAQEAVYPARVKAEVVDRTLDDLSSNLHKLQEIVKAMGKTTEPTKKTPGKGQDGGDADGEDEPSGDFDELVKAEKMDAIMDEICRSVGEIEVRSDWLECMRYLEFCAMALAFGFNDLEVIERRKPR